MDESHALYGSYIAVQFVFENTLDHDILRKSISALCRAFPALTGRADFKRGAVNMAAAVEPSLGIVKGFPGNASDYAEAGLAQDDRFAFVDEPRRADIFAGRGPLSTFRLTEFSGGGCILAIGISHALVDGAGFHMLTRYLSACYTALTCGDNSPNSPFAELPDVLIFGSGSGKKAVKSNLKKDGIPMPIPVKGIFGSLWERLIMAIMGRNRKTPRAVFYFSKDQVNQVKQTVLEESGEPWISTNIALGAHFARIMARLQFGDKPKRQMQIGQVLDIRSRYFEDKDGQQSRYPGNAILIYTDSGEFEDGFQNTPRGQIARFMKSSLERLDGPFVKQRLDIIEDALRWGWTYPGLDIRRPMIAVNNQSKMDIYAADFGHNLLRVIPQDVGDHIMLYPAIDGGFEIYLRDLVKPGRQAELYSSKWQSEIYDLG